MQNLVGMQLGAYRVVERIGEGGMATVFKAYQASVDRFVALKVLPAQFANDPQFMGRFQQEARTIAKLEHPNVLPVYDFGEQDGITYLVMRYLQAGSLKEILGEGPLPFADIVRVMNQVGSGLDYAHRQGVIHRDIKPANILVDRDSNAFLTDFGIAKILEGNVSFTATGGTVGTPTYMAPEQSMGEQVDTRADIYSLGITLYEMLTGRVPFQADTPVAVILKHLHDPLPMPRDFNPDIPVEVERVVLRALAKDPDERYERASEMAADLERAMSLAETREARRSELRDRAEQTADMRSSAVITPEVRKMIEELATQQSSPTGAGQQTPTDSQTVIVQGGLPGWALGLLMVAVLVALAAVGLLSVQVLGIGAQPTATWTTIPTLTPNLDATGTRQAFDDIFASQTATAEEARSTAVAAAQDLIATLTTEAEARVTRTAEAAGDIDEDGANYAEEMRVGTDPENPDTDGDGVLDGREIHDLQTDPLSPDTDEDGLADNAELRAGTDPADPDTDKDGIPDGTDDDPLTVATMTPLPTETVAPFAADPIYYHPSGYFQIDPPAGWRRTETHDSMTASASWQSENMEGMVSVYVRRLNMFLTHEDLAEYAMNLLSEGPAVYDIMTIIERDDASDPVELKFAAIHGGKDYVGRHWTGVEDDLIWYLDVVVMEDGPFRLDELVSLALPALNVDPNGELGLSFEPVEPGELYTDPEGRFELTPPARWLLERSEMGDIERIQWLYGGDIMAQVTLDLFALDKPFDVDDAVSYLNRGLHDIYDRFDDYAVIGRGHEDKPVWHELRLWRGERHYLQRQWAGGAGRTAWVLSVLVPDDYPGMLNALHDLMLSSFQFNVQSEMVPDAALSPGPVYYHPSGDFEMVSPAGWKIMETINASFGGDYIQSGETLVNAVGWTLPGEDVQVGAGVLHMEKPLTRQDLVAFVVAYSTDFWPYDEFTIVDSDYASPVIRLDVEAELAGEAFVARQWNSIVGDVVWFLHISAPAGQKDLLPPLEALILPSLKVYEDASAGLVWPGPVELGEMYTHPSGVFTIQPPAGWQIAESQARGFDLVTWQTQNPQASVSVELHRLDEPLALDDRVAYLNKSLLYLYDEFDDYVTLGLDAKGDPVRRDIRLWRDTESYLLRRWAGSEEGLAWVVSFLAPGDYPTLLNELETTILPTFALQTPVETAPPVEMEPGVPYTHSSGLFEITPPDGWAREEASDSDGFRVTWSDWDLGAFVNVDLFRLDAPMTHEEMVSSFRDHLDEFFDPSEEYTLLDSDLERDPLRLDFELQRDGVKSLMRVFAGTEDNLLWTVALGAPVEYSALLKPLESMVMPSFRLYPEVELQKLSDAVAEALAKTAGQSPLYDEDFAEGFGFWQMEDAAEHQAGRVSLPPDSEITCDCWGIANFVLRAELQIDAPTGTDESFVGLSFGSYKLFIDLEADKEALVSLNEAGEPVITFSVDRALLKDKPLPLTLILHPNGQLVMLLGKEETPVLVTENIWPADGAFSWFTGAEATLSLESFRLWDLAPPKLLDGGETSARRLDVRLGQLIGRIPPDVEDNFDEIGDAWWIEGGICDVPGKLGLCDNAHAVYRYRAVRDFVMQVTVDVDWSRVGDWSPLRVRFPAADGTYRFLLNLMDDRYPEASIYHVFEDGRNETIVSGPIDPALLIDGAFKLRLMYYEGRVAVLIEGTPVLFVDRLPPPGAGLVSFDVEQLAVTLDDFRLWAIGPSPEPSAMDVWTCAAEDGPHNTLCLEIPHRPVLPFDTLSFDVGSPAWAPDGRQIVLEGEGLPPDYFSRLWIVDVECYERPDCLGEPRPLLHDEVEYATQPDWSFNGEWIAFLDDCGLSIVRPDGSDYRTLWAPEEGSQCAVALSWSPPGVPGEALRLAAVVEDLRGEGNSFEQRVRVLVFDLATRTMKPIYEEVRTARLYFNGLTWFPEGDRLVAEVYDERSESDLFLAFSLEGGEPVPVEEGAEMPRFIDWLKWHWPRWDHLPGRPPP